MCRCLQNLWEDCYWHCIEEKFCFDENIAYYNPDEDEANAAEKKTSKNALGLDAGAGFVGGDRKNSEIIVNQPLARHCSVLGAKAHEDDFQREIQTTVPILAPEVMAAFAQSQIFQEHSHKPKAALSRIETKARITAADVTGSHNVRGQEQDAAAEKLLSRLEGIPVDDHTDDDEDGTGSPVMFKLAGEDISSVQRTKTIHSIAEEDDGSDDNSDIPARVDLRRKPLSASSQTLSPSVHKKRVVHQRLKHVQSVPQFPTYPGSAAAISGRPWSQAAETMTKDGIFIIPTPEMPAISLKKLPRNYLDTPSVDPYQPSTSLTSIQMQNKQLEDKFNFQMPRYYGHSELYLPTPAISQEEINRSNLRANKAVSASLKKNLSMVNLNRRSASPDSKSASTQNIMQAGRSEGQGMMKVGSSEGSVASGSGGVSGEKSKRLKVLRGNLPPLMIQTKDKGAAVERDRH